MSGAVPFGVTVRSATNPAHFVAAAADPIGSDAPDREVGASGTPPAAAAATGFDLATAAYAQLAAGKRRDAARLFAAAIAAGGDQQAAWRAERDRLTRRWSASAYSIVRAGSSTASAIAPVLGGSQSGATIAFTPDPLAARPFALTVRGSLAHDDGGRSAFAAVGVQWHLLPHVSVAAERLIAIGPAAPRSWAVRLAAGDEVRRGRWRAVGYAEGGTVGNSVYAAAQAQAGIVVEAGRAALFPAVGIWGSIEHDHGRPVDRLDLGPGMTVRAGPVGIELDYRVRVTGNAQPGSGPVLTATAGF